MEGKTYYQILGVSSTASLAEITAAKNRLAKEYHPDVNMRKGIDTTALMQEVLEAYQILSDETTRADYDRRIAGRSAVMQTFDLHEAAENEAQEDPAFVTYWKASNDLYDIVTESDALFRQKDETSRIAQLALQALRHILTLREGQIPERYWHPDIMNWLLFAWYKNRNFTTAYLLTLYDEHMKNEIPVMDKLRLKNKSMRYQHSVKRLIKY
ncbi:MAG TPA: DnaJ domain-containing protein [Candidatus Dorea merdavium]|uniref:J domain-containing protein n=1 Tax=Massilistercora timonensis TaxID=2086584 RepID=UPI001F8CF7EF|nr:DnaJ domain-containing protein [Candidatus Dorea merdavium]